MLQFQKIAVEEISVLQQLATKIWHDNYSQMLSQQQINYMLDLMYNTALLTQEIKDTEFVWNFICWEQHKAGYFCCKKENKKLFLSKLYLDISVQGKGIAQQTLWHIKQLAHEKHCTSIYLTVNKTNEKGIKAYQKFGFKNIKTNVSDIGNGFVMDDFVYEYPLDNSANF